MAVAIRFAAAFLVEVTTARTGLLREEYRL
jgi:hypothetical protein